jgi:hypothetical protein
MRNARAVNPHGASRNARQTRSRSYLEHDLIEAPLLPAALKTRVATQWALAFLPKADERLPVRHSAPATCRSVVLEPIEVPSGMRLEFGGGISGNMRLSFQAARSIG